MEQVCRLCGVFGCAEDAHVCLDVLKMHMFCLLLRAGQVTTVIQPTTVACAHPAAEQLMDAKEPIMFRRDVAAWSAYPSLLGQYVRIILSDLYHRAMCWQVRW